MPLPPLVTAFVGERYAERERLNDLVAPPYDVVSAERRAALAARHPHNVVHLVLPEDPGDRYAGAARLLKAWRDEGVLVSDREPSVTILEQRFATPDGIWHGRLGLIAAVRAEPYTTRRVRPHERTHQEPREDRLRLLMATATALEPILLLSRDTVGAVNTFLQQETARPPDATAELDGVNLATWVVWRDRALPALEALNGEPLYIADGHHRYETAAAFARDVGPDRMTALIVAVSDPGLVVLPTHRLVVGRHADRERFYEAVSHDMEPARDAEPQCLVVWPDGRETRFVVKRRSEEPLIAEIDRLVVRALLDAALPEPRLAYTHDAVEARAMVRGGEAAAAVLVHPTPVEEMLAVADRGEFLPAKSTYFHPKVPGGLVFCRLG